jgi:hypothetical protein
MKESNIMEMPPRDLEKDKLVTFQVASYSYAQIGVIETGVCFLVWFMVCSFLFILLTSVFKERYPYLHIMLFYFVNLCHVKLFDHYGISAADLFGMNNDYFNIDGIGNADGTYVSSSGKSFTSSEQTFLLGRSQV